ncbi:MAG: hypothetical protein AAFP99_09520 [Pseudomonadota bacterium]
MTAAIGTIAIGGLAQAQTVELAQNSCQAIGQRVASQNGATLVSAKQEGSVCRVVILKPGSGGSRPRRETIDVAM